MLWTVLKTSAVALTCDRPAETPVPVGASAEEADQIRFEALVESVTPVSNGFVVFGEFFKVRQLPFMHTVEHDQRLARWYKQDQLFDEIQGSIEYTYIREIGFRGVRLSEAGLIPFETNDTIISVPVEGEFLGQLPEQSTPVLGKLRQDENHASLMRIPSHLCPDFYRMDEEKLLEVVDCLSTKKSCLNLRSD